MGGWGGIPTPLVSPRPWLQVLLLDINCQFSKHLSRNYPALASNLHFYIGWLHAKAGHNLECQMQFNALLAPGLGRCFGEAIEQCWVGRICWHVGCEFWLLCCMLVENVGWALAAAH